MNIQWFPGHMTKAFRMMEENIKLVDILIYVLDSRAPYSCINPKLNELVKDKPILYILNKSDIADDRLTKEFINYFSKTGEVVSVIGNDSKFRDQILKKIKLISKPISDKYKAKGINRPIRAMVVGVPNCGKSTIINLLSKEKRANVGDKPGVTKGKQWIRLESSLELLDTPGTLWGKFEDQDLALNLALIGSINDDILDKNELSIELIKKLKENYLNEFLTRYKIESFEDPKDAIEKISKKRGFILKGNELDYDRCSSTLIEEFRKGKIGKITLDKVPNK